MDSNPRSRAIKGWLAACAAATAALYVLVLILFVIAPGLSVGPGDRSMAVTGEGLLAGLIFFPLILILTCLLTAIPAALVIWLSERSRMRSALFFGCAGGAIGALSQTIVFLSFYVPAAVVFVPAGLVAGLTYWHIVARPAGGEPG
jgi:hypothetical protein